MNTEPADDVGINTSLRMENTCVWESRSVEDDRRSVASSCGSRRSGTSLRAIDSDAELLALEEQRKSVVREAE